MTKFFLMTRGRTGSTAVLDELGKSKGICAMQELFITFDFPKPSKQEIEFMFKFILPFDYWRREVNWCAKIVPAAFLADRYLAEAEDQGKRQRAQGFGFKVLSHHLDRYPFLEKLLKRRGYRALYLTRNLARQVLSGMIAKQRGVYNTENEFLDSNCYTVDLDEFQKLIEWEAQSVKDDCARIKAAGFDCQIITYEQFSMDRNAFFKLIFDFLGVESEVPEASTFTVMIKDPRATIANFDAVTERARSIDLQLED